MNYVTKYIDVKIVVSVIAAMAVWAIVGDAINNAVSRARAVAGI